MANSKDIAAVPESGEVVREMAQITFGLQNEMTRKNRAKRAEADREANNSSGNGNDGNENSDQQTSKKSGKDYQPIGLSGKDSPHAAKDPIKNKIANSPKTIGSNLHELNKVKGTKGEDGYYKGSFNGLKVKSLNSRNMSATRDGETKPAFKMVNGRTKTNNLSKDEVKSIATSKSKSASKDKGAGRDV